MLKGLGNIASMLKQAQEMQGRFAEVKEKVAELRVEGTAGGEMVKVAAGGDMKILSVTLEPSLLQTGDHEMIEELVTAATNQALQKAKDAAAAAMSEVTAGLDIPGLGEALSRLGLNP